MSVVAIIIGILAMLVGAIISDAVKYLRDRAWKQKIGMFFLGIASLMFGAVALGVGIGI